MPSASRAILTDVTLNLGPRPLVLLGAGASVEAGVPATFTMTEKLVAAIGQLPHSTIAQALNFVCGALMSHDSAQGKSPYIGPDVERVFAAVELLAERNELEVTPFVSTWHQGVDAWDKKAAPPFFEHNFQQALAGRVGRRVQPLIEGLISSMTNPGTGEVYKYLAREMIDHLRKIVAPPYVSLSYLVPLISAASSPGGITIATLNYDLTIEQACHEAEISADTGIERWIKERQWNWADDGVRLLKLHGSIDWCWEPLPTDQGEMEMPTVVQSTAPGSENRDPVLVFGLRNKLRPDGPFLSLLAEFEDMLSACDRLIVVGYSFRDEHINEIIRRWTRDDKTRTLALVDPQPQEGPSRRGFREQLIGSLNPWSPPGGEELPQRVEIRKETAAQAFAQLARPDV
jgi:SIR2-like domain